MKTLILQDIIKAAKGEILQGRDDLKIKNFTVLRKKIKQGTLFFDIYQDNGPMPTAPSGFSFAVLTDKPESFAASSDNIAVIRVDDIKSAYWKCIEYYRGLFGIPVIGVTGTCGKTTTKEMIRHILSQKLNVTATYKSYNAQFRHLEYLMDFDDDTQAAVIEMGVAAPGDLKVACRYFRPQVGVITNIGIDHFNAFGSLERYINGKAEFLEGLDNGGTLVINGDDENIKKISFEKYNGKIIRFGFGDDSDFKIITLNQLQQGLDFSLRHEGIHYYFYVPGHGEFLVKNAAAAIAASHAAGFNVNEAGKSLRSFHNVERHFELKKGLNGGIVIDDTWSSNPTSAIEALRILKSISNGKKSIAVLGKMSLLGRRSGYFHFSVGEAAAAIGIDELIVIGKDSREIGNGALSTGMSPGSIHFCTDSGEAYEILRKMMSQDSVTLIKTTMLASYAGLTAKITLHEKDHIT